MMHQDMENACPPNHSRVIHSETTSTSFIFGSLQVWLSSGGAGAGSRPTVSCGTLGPQFFHWSNGK